MPGLPIEPSRPRGPQAADHFSCSSDLHVAGPQRDVSRAPPSRRAGLGWGLGAEPETIEKKSSSPGGSQSDPGGPGGRWERLALAASGCDRAWTVPRFYLPGSPRGEDPAPSLPRTPPHGKVGKSPWPRKMLDAQGPIAETAARLFAEAFMLQSALRCLAPVYPEHDANASTSADLSLSLSFARLFCVFCHRSFDRMETRPVPQEHRTCFRRLCKPSLPCQLILTMVVLRRSKSKSGPDNRPPSPHPLRSNKCCGGSEKQVWRMDALQQ